MESAPLHDARKTSASEVHYSQETLYQILFTLNYITLYIHIVYLCIAMTVHFSCSRYVARTQLEALKDSGFWLNSYFDIQFKVVKRTSKKTEVFPNGVFFAPDLSLDDFNNVRFAEQLHKAGVNVIEIRKRNALGLFEIMLAYDVGLKSADDVFRAKHFTKEIINRYFKDQQAIFMTKPF